MTLTPDELKREAAAQKAEIESRVKGRQGGVATYFDVFLGKFLDRLAASEQLHGWNAHPEDLSRADIARAVTELQWLTTYLENQKEGRFVTYDARRRGDNAGKQSDIRSPERS